MTAQPWETRIARLEGAYEQVDRRLGAIDARLETLDAKIDGVREELSRRLESLREGLEGRFDRLQWRLTSLIVGTWITVMLAIFLHKT